MWGVFLFLFLWHTTKPGTLEHGTTEHGTPAEHRNTGGTTEYHGTAEQRNNKTTQQEILPMQNNDILSRYHN